MTSHIAMLEPEVAARASIPFAALCGATAASGADALKRILDEFGFAVVTDVVDESRLQRWEGLWGDDLKAIVDPSSSREAVAALEGDIVHKWPQPLAPVGSKFASDYGLPQGRLGWAVRTDPDVKRVFAAIFGTDDLCVGCDNIFFQNTPCEQPKDELRESSLWPHADQNAYNLPGGSYNCYQGVMYLWPASLDTAATVVWPGSHRSMYPELMTDAKRWTGRGHFCTLNKADVPTFAQRCRRVPVPRGGLLLWDSRTIHQGWPCGPRLAVPVCFEPKARRGGDALASKKKCILAGAPTTHWASLAVAHSVHRPADMTSTASGLVLRHAAHQFMGGRIPDEVFAVL